VESYLRPRRPDRIAQVGEDDDETSVIAAAAKTPLDDTLKTVTASNRSDRGRAEDSATVWGSKAARGAGW